MTLLPLYSIGGMGAGDVKLMAGIGAWIGPWLTLWAFLSTAMAGAVMAAAMIVYSGEMYRHLAMMHHDRPRGLDHPQPGGAVRAGGRTQAHDEALALRHSDRGRLDCLFRLDRLLDLIRSFRDPRHVPVERK